MSHPELSYSIVVPIHNEAEHVARLAAEMAAEVVQATGRGQELILVENGSVDDTAARAQKVCEQLGAAGWRARVLQLAEADYGAALRAGFLSATGAWVVNFDIDYFSGAFVARLSDVEADIVIASKRDPLSQDRRALIRRLATWGFNILLRTLLASNVTDTHGIKGFRREVVEQLTPRVLSNRDLFDTELVLRAERAGHRIAEVPIIVEERREARTSLVKRIPRTLRGVFYLRRSFANERRKTTSR